MVERLDLVIVPPVEFAQLMRLERALRQVPGVRILGTGGSAGGGARMSLSFKEIADPLGMLRDLPPVEEVVSEEQLAAHPLGEMLQKVAGKQPRTPGKRLFVLLSKA